MRVVSENSKILLIVLHSNHLYYVIENEFILNDCACDWSILCKDNQDFAFVLLDTAFLVIFVLENVKIRIGKIYVCKSYPP